ncbi:uncharacterized protein LOC132784897 [Drosophila nasuta]|uniref:Uncharacterized protein LOC117563465 n=1 Tax=Drosophila albomicans TaxID=7291 RepID=A0A6P8WEL2_DROAB|nr:uncharacterized protein LOC117563465 [Drosophila albomicans]XP_060646816.1 uncharacterized protein LOC132784897 [Drosophila nasuta]
METNTERSTEATSTELRREARRKKILESAKSRLEKLNGRVHPHDANSPEVLEYSDPEVEPNIQVGSKNYQEDAFNSVFFTSASSNTTNLETPSFFVKSRALIFVAAIVGYILSQYANNILFVPVGLCILIEVFYYKGHQYLNNNIVNMIVPMVLLFAGPSLGNKIKQINSLVSISQSLLINLAITIFCICLSSFLFQLFSLNHIVEIK